MATRLVDIASYLFSKNAGPYLITFDVVLPDMTTYERVRRANLFTPEKIGALFNIKPERIVSTHEYDAGRVLKFTITREISSGDFGDSSVFGSQQWAPLINLEVPDDTGDERPS